MRRVLFRKGTLVQEKRKQTRDRTYLGGRIAFNHREATADCLVRNLSESGALLEFDNTIGLPSVFDLTIRHKGDSRRAELVWRTDRAMGVVFDAPHAATVMSIETARRLRQLKSERDRLAQRVRQLSEPF